MMVAWWLSWKQWCISEDEIAVVYVLLKYSDVCTMMTVLFWHWWQWHTSSILEPLTVEWSDWQNWHWHVCVWIHLTVKVWWIWFEVFTSTLSTCTTADRYKPYNVDDTVLMLMDRIRSDDMNEELPGQNALGHRHCEDRELLILFLTECFVQGVIHRPDETILTAVNE